MWIRLKDHVEMESERARGRIGVEKAGHGERKIGWLSLLRKPRDQACLEVIA